LRGRFHGVRPVRSKLRKLFVKIVLVLDLGTETDDGSRRGAGHLASGG